MMVSTGEVRWFLMIACVLIFVVVFAWMLNFCVAASPGWRQENLNFHGSVTIEIVWTLAPCSSSDPWYGQPSDRF